jgi:hypothetical protein
MPMTGTAAAATIKRCGAATREARMPRELLDHHRRQLTDKKTDDPAHFDTAVNAP